MVKYPFSGNTARKKKEILIFKLLEQNEVNNNVAESQNANINII